MLELLLWMQAVDVAAKMPGCSVAAAAITRQDSLQELCSA
jgi:hypothetical protein